MASSTLLALLAIALAIAISSQGSMGAYVGNKIECEYLDEESCAYAVSSTGKRCVLEKCVLSSGHTCRTSEIVAGQMSGLVETKECVDACHVDRKDLGISSDYFLEHAFVESLCSDQCYRKCPNIVNLFFNLAAGEGIYLPKLCETRGSNGRREMSELKNGGMIPVDVACAPV